MTTTKQILEAMTKGAILCMEYDGSNKVFWIEPRRSHRAVGRGRENYWPAERKERRRQPL